MSDPQPVPPVVTSSRSKTSTLKPAPNPFQREIVAPDKYPRVRWHSVRYVMICRHSMQFLLFALFALISFLIGPSLVSFMYPNVILPFAPHLEWKCTPIGNYININPNNKVLETNLWAASSAVQIQLYLSGGPKSFDKLEKVLLVIDDCAFDHYGKNVMLCRPFMNHDSRPTFEQYVKMAESCYHYIRQITRKAKIAGYGKGIMANVLLAAAVRLREESCFHFEKLYLEDPIPDVKAEFEKSRWIGMAYMLPGLRDKLINDAIMDHGLNEAEFSENLKKIGNTPVLVLTNDEDDRIYGKLTSSARRINKKEFDKDVAAKSSVTVVKGLFQFRHDHEETCAVELKKPVIPLHVAPSK